MTAHEVIMSAVATMDAIGIELSADRRARLIVQSLRDNGYVIKRALAPCRAHDFEDINGSN